MKYPDKLTIFVPQFLIVIDHNVRAYSNRTIYLRAFSLLRAERGNDNRINFRERVEIDSAGDQSIDLLTKLGDELEPDVTLGGWRLDLQIASLIRVPRDSDREAEGKVPLQRLSLALGNQPIDVGWFDRAGGLSTLIHTAASFRLPAKWQNQQPAREAIDAQLMAARAHSVWLAIAEKLFDQGEARRKAFASFDKFISKKGGMNKENGK
jgi:hypothetical protein